MTIDIRAPRRLRQSLAKPRADRSRRNREPWRPCPWRRRQPEISAPGLLLPEPLSPTIPNRSRRAVKVTPRTTRTGPRGVGKATLRPRRSEARGHLRPAFGPSRRPSPSRLKPSETTKIATPAGDPPLVDRTAGPKRIIAPHFRCGGCAPRPRKPRPAAVRMMPAMSSVTRMMTDDRQSGVTWPQRMRADDAPKPRGVDVVAVADGQCSCSREARGGHEVIAMAMTQFSIAKGRARRPTRGL